MNIFQVIVSWLCVVTLSTLAWAQESEVDSPPLPLEPETSIPVDDDLAEGFQSMERLKQLLKSLGDPTEKQDSESNAEYLERVDRTIKGRALYLHHLHQEIEKMLMVKYRMQEACRAYENWIIAVDESLQNQPSQYTNEIAVLEEKRDGLARDAIVLADLLMEQAISEGNAAVQSELEEFWGTNEELKAEVALIPDASERRSSFDNLTTVEQKREKLAEIQVLDEEADIESQLLRDVGLPEAERFLKHLPDAHRKVYAALAETLTRRKEDLKQVELMATRVSVLARFAKNNLLIVRPKEVVSGGELGAKETAALSETQAALAAAFKDFNDTTGTGVITTVGTDSGKRFLNRLKQRRTSTDGDTEQ